MTNGEKILLLLSEFRRYEKDYRVPEELSQDGIAEIVGMRRGNVARELIKLRNRGFVTERLVHFEGSRRRKKGYFLTGSGMNLSIKIKDFVKDQRIIFTDENGLSSEVTITEAVRQLGKGALYAEVVSGLQDGRSYNAGSFAAESDIAQPVDQKQVSQFIGRVAELNWIKELAMNALEGNGSSLLISGEAGVGKTRLVHEVVNLFKGEEIRFLKANCLYQTAVDPYLPLVDTLGDCLSKAKEDLKNTALTQIRAGAPEFIGLLPLGTEVHQIEPPSVEKAIDLEGERSRIFETFRSVINTLTENKPLILFVDDLHWSDAGTIHLIHHLAKNTRNAPILIVGAYRPEDLLPENGKAHPLLETIESIRKEKLVVEIDLDRLSLDDIIQVVRSRLNLEDVPEELSTILFEESEGNPFFLEELLDSLKEEEKLAGLNADWTMPPEVRIPEGIKGVIERRINRLREEQRKLLEMASVIGEKFDFDLILQSTQEDESALLDIFDELIEIRLIYEDSSDIGSYRFHHGKIPEVLYKDMNKAKKRFLHGKVARILEKLYEEDIKKGAAELAYHYSKTKDYDKTYTYSLMAGDGAAVLYSYDEAISHYRTALDALEKIGDNPNMMREIGWNNIELLNNKAEVLFKQGKAFDVLGRWEDSIDSHERARDVVASNRKKVEIISNIGDMHRKKGMLVEALKACEDGLGLVKEDCRENCLLLNAIGNIISSEGRLEDSLEYYEKGLEIAERINDHIISGMIFANTAVCYSRMGKAEKSIEYHKKALKTWEQIGNLEFIAITCQNLGISYTRLGRYREALELFRKSLELASKIGEQERISDINLIMGLIYSIMDDHEKGADLLEKSLVIKEKIGDHPKMVYGLTNLGRCYFEMALLEKAEEALKKGLELGADIGGTKEALVQSYCELARCSLGRNDKVKALEYCNLAQALTDELKSKISVGITQKAFGIVNTEMGEFEKSGRNFEESIRIWKEINNIPQLEETYYEYAKMLKIKGDINKAKEYLEQTLAILMESGLDKKAKRVKKEFADIVEL
jgi:predicted ATPase